MIWRVAVVVAIVAAMIQAPGAADGPPPHCSDYHDRAVAAEWVRHAENIDNFDHTGGEAREFFLRRGCDVVGRCEPDIPCERPSAAVEPPPIVGNICDACPDEAAQSGPGPALRLSLIHI